MGKKGKSNGAAPRPKVRVRVARLAPVLKAGGEVIFGRPNRFKGALQTGQESGMRAGLAQAGKLALMEMTGFHGGAVAGDNDSWDFRYVRENVMLAGGGYVASKVMDWSGVNRSLGAATKQRVRI